MSARVGPARSGRLGGLRRADVTRQDRAPGSTRAITASVTALAPPAS
jgi:hypothetical protein